MKLTALLLVLIAGVAQAAAPDVFVVDGGEASFMHDALKRINCPFDHAPAAEAARLAQYRIVILCGKNVQADALVVGDYLRNGGHVLAVGGGAKSMIDATLFDARGYYPTGTTEHMTTFAGYHPVMFGYPMASPVENWLVGVPSLLRATGGPLMRLGPQASSILSAGEPFSLAAFQRSGRGIALLIGADPQGGNEYQSLGKPTPKRGDESRTDKLLAGAIAWLREPVVNLIPNAGFEESTDSNPEHSYWNFTVNNGGRGAFSRAKAHAGKTCVELAGNKTNSLATLATHRPIVVEHGKNYRLACQYRSTARWSLDVRYFRTPAEAETKVEPQTLAAPAAEDWQRFETELKVPADAHLVSLTFRQQGSGELGLDDISLVLAE